MKYAPVWVVQVKDSVSVAKAGNPIMIRESRFAVQSPDQALRHFNSYTGYNLTKKQVEITEY